MKQNNTLIIRQMDRKLHGLQVLQEASLPTGGWIGTIRKALNMSLRQLGARLSITPQSMRDIEIREAEGTITLNTLKESAGALGMKLVYGFVPVDITLEKMIEQKANELARKIVSRTSTTMKLEDQENSKERLEQAIADLTDELKKEMPKKLWD